MEIKKQNTKNQLAKPFLKWAGGKSQLLQTIEAYYPFDKGINKYAEPFVGGGAVLFDILNKFNLNGVYISDINAELINTYLTIQNDVDNLISQLEHYENTFLPKTAEERKTYYLELRARFNNIRLIDKLNTENKNNTNTEKAALFIFLNKTCFNGLFRVNKKGEYNVPMGDYKNPTICDKENLLNVSQKLKNVFIECGDYTCLDKYIDSNTFVYFDPPYRPLTKSANFTSYTKSKFNDTNQIELSKYVQKLCDRGALTAVSNSDPKNADTSDNFFDELYSKQKITRINAKRMINCDGKKRGSVSELLISNF